MKLYLSPKAQYQYQCLKGRSVPYAEQVKTLLDSSGLNVPPVSLSNVPGISESNVPPIKPARSRSGKQSIELRTPTGTMMRISGNLSGRELKDIIIASSTHV